MAAPAAFAKAVGAPERSRGDVRLVTTPNPNNKSGILFANAEYDDFAFRLPYGSGKSFW